MSRHESDREDLMREAVALIRRVELTLPGRDNPVVCGFRSNGWLSLYFGPDPVYHFDSEGLLRRAFVGGLLYRTQGTTLAELDRQRTDEGTLLQRHDLSPDELARFVSTAAHRLREFLGRLESGAAEVTAQVPSEEPIVPDLIDAVQSIVESGVRLAPAIKGKR